MAVDEITQRIRGAREALGGDAVVLGHHYQREDIIQFADERGDSFVLAQFAAERPESKYIIFCGVHFMAEAADILPSDEQAVVLPNMEAACSMADIASAPAVYSAWRELDEHLGGTDDILPVTHLNSAAPLTAFSGHHGGVGLTPFHAARGSRPATAGGTGPARARARRGVTRATATSLMWSVSVELGGPVPVPVIRPRTSSARIRRWPPLVRYERSSPESAHRRTVDSLTPSRAPAAPSVIHGRSSEVMLLTFPT